VAGPKIDAVTEEVLEQAAAGSLRYLEGVDVQAGGRLVVGLSEESTATPAQMAETMARALRFHFPKLTRVDVRFIFDQKARAKLRPQVQAYRKKRSRAVGKVTEDSLPEFLLCASCQPFSAEHTCVITPGRPPMCGRLWQEMRAAAYLNVDDPGHPYRRRNYPLARVLVPVAKGQVLDARRGEYAGVNRAIQKLSGGKIKRVFLHSLFEHPHSSCSCFRNLAFVIPGADGIGVMNRGFAGKTPDGRSWDNLGNEAAGKQQAGITGVGPLYLRSPNFLQGEGGWDAVVWMPAELKEKLEDVIPAGARIATENDAKTLDELRAFLTRKKGKQTKKATAKRKSRTR
jgi:acetyl-CoA decarbonylase/synthase complex subunit beta